ncbi:MAG: D-xylose transporter XylE [Bacteroidales bacterium]|nr:D-xylose transporter XylE [Bacteroidales bacterium]
MTATQQGASRGYLLFITIVAVLGGLLFGYDTAVISGAERGLQAFFEGAKDFTYTEFLHGFTSSSALIGCIIGSAISGLMAGRLGRKKSLFIAGICFFLSAAGSYNPEFLFFEKGVATKGLWIAFNLYRVLGGIGVGMASAICPMYIAEVAPANKRGQLVSWNQFAIIFGQLVVYFVNFLIIQSHKNDPAVVEWTNQVGWRLMFGSECVPAGLFTLLILLVPETPRYLVMSGHDSKALEVLSKINGPTVAQQVLSEIKNTVVEKKEKLFAYGVLVIFIGCMLSVFQQFVGINAVLYFAPRIFDSMGMGDPMTQTVMMGIVNISFTLVAIFTVEKLGRKPLLITGSLGMALGAIGVALADALPAVPGIVGVLSIMIYSASFMFSWGPICWVLISEIFPNTIRGAAVAIAVAFQWISNFIVSSTFVPLYTWSPAFTYGMYAFFCVIAAIFVWRLVPETKGKTLEDMSNLWRNRK